MPSILLVNPPELRCSTLMVTGKLPLIDVNISEVVSCVDYSERRPRRPVSKDSGGSHDTVNNQLSPGK